MAYCDTQPLEVIQNWNPRVGDMAKIAFVCIRASPHERCVMDTVANIRGAATPARDFEQLPLTCSIRLELLSRQSTSYVVIYF